jgi:hypothetical protein
VRTRSAHEWRDFWRDGGERELAAQLDEFEPYMPRISTLLGSRAPREALAAELGRIREHELHAPRDSQRDDEIATRIHEWFTHA